jgi:RNA polymerase sigma-70 factor (ECF subfamily)
VDPLTQPIHRHPHSSRDSYLEGPDEDPAFDDAAETDDPVPEINEHGEIVDSAQPLGEIGVTDDMSTMAINPAQAGPGDLEQFAESNAPPALLHLNGDFAQMDDAAIMLELKAGNMAGFDFLIQKYRKPIINFMYRMTRNQAVAEELAQEVFLRVYRSRETYRAEARFSTWLYRIAINTGRNWLASNSRRPSAPNAYENEDGETFNETDNLTDNNTPESAMASREIAETVNKSIEDLPEDLRTAIVLREIEGMSYEDIAATMNCPIGTVRSRIFRARESIAAKLRPVLGGNGDTRW